MTVTASPRIAGPYIGNASATSFPFAFKVFARSDVQVAIYLADGTAVPAVLDSNYTVTLNADQTTAPGGSVLYPVAGAPLPVGATLTIAGALPYNQTLTLPGGGNFNPVAIENAFDRTEIQIQQLLEKSGRALTFPLGEGAAPAFPPVAERANKLLGFDASGDFIGVLPTAGDATSLALDLTNKVNAAKGAGMLGFNGQLNYAAGTIGWALQQDGANVMWFANGATINDGVTAADAAFAAARDWAGIGRPIFVPKGKYALYAQFSLLQSQKLVGESTLSAFKSNLYLQLSTINVFVGQGGTATPAVLLDLGSGVHGICFNHPNQVAETAAAPIQFGWTIATDTSKAYMIDDVTIRDVMFVNAYMGISLDKAGRFNVENVYGDTLKEGVFVDRVFDVGRMSHVHLWTFTYTPGSNMMTWIAANGRAFNFGRADGMVGVDLFQYGRNVGFDFNDAGSSGFWGDFTGCFSDVANFPIRINKVARIKWLGGSLIPYLASQPCVTTSADVSTVGQGAAFVAFYGTQFHDTARCGAVVSSATGNFSFTDCDFERAEVTVINEGAANVDVTAPKTRFGLNSRLTVLGDGASTKFNGVPNPVRSVDVSPGNFGMGTFTAGVPDNWTFIAGSSANITNLGGGYVQLNFNSATTSAMSYALPNSIMQRRSLYTIYVNVQFNSVTDGILTFHCRRSGAAFAQSVRSFSAFNHGQAYWYAIPVIVGYDTGLITIDVEWSSASSGPSSTGFVVLAGMSLWECADSVMRQDMIDSVYRREFLDPLGYSTAIAKPGSNRVVQHAVAAPTAGTWLAGDRQVRAPQVVGQPKGWVCTVSGTPGTWASEGNL